MFTGGVDTSFSTILEAIDHFRNVPIFGSTKLTVPYSETGNRNSAYFMQNANR
jgi:hypothetical protein